MDLHNSTMFNFITAHVLQMLCFYFSKLSRVLILLLKIFVIFLMTRQLVNVVIGQCNQCPSSNCNLPYSDSLNRLKLFIFYSFIFY